MSMQRKTYKDKAVEQWNANDFLKYMCDEHLERFKCEYAPFGSWSAERGCLWQYIGTIKKAGKYDKALIKEFIDYCFKTYKPTASFPGINFGFMATYRKNDLSRLQKQRNQKINDTVESKKTIEDDVLNWLIN